MLVKINQQEINAYLTEQELIELKHQIDPDSAAIGDELKQVEAQAKLTGEEIEPAWRRWAVQVYKHRRRLALAIEDELARSRGYGQTPLYWIHSTKRQSSSITKILFLPDHA